MKEEEKFKKQNSVWCVVIEGGEVAVEHNGYAEICQRVEDIADVADFMADYVRRTIVAMPKNNAKKVQFDCSWE